MTETLDARIRCLENVIADLDIRFLHIEDKFADLIDRLHALELMQFNARADFLNTHPRAVDDLNHIDRLLGVKPPQNNSNT